MMGGGMVLPDKLIMCLLLKGDWLPVPSTDYLYLWQKGKEPGPKLQEKHKWWNLLALPLTMWHCRDSHWPLKLLSQDFPQQFLKGQRSSGNVKSKTWGNNCTRSCFLLESVKMITAKPGLLLYNFFLTWRLNIRLEKPSLYKKANY